MEGAKTKDNWTSWSVKGVTILHLLFFYVFVVICCLQVTWFVFFLHGGDGTWCWFDKNLTLCGVGNRGSANMVVYKHGSNWWKVKFLDLRKTLCYLIRVFGLWFNKSWGFEMAMFRQLKFVKEECPIIQ